MQMVHVFNAFDNDKIKKDDLILFFFLNLLIFSFFLFCPSIGDDCYFSSIELPNLFLHAKTRWMNWSSRLLIEFCLVLFLKLPRVFFAVLSTVLFISVVYNLTYILLKQFDFNSFFTCFFLSTLYPLRMMTSAGLYATTINYLYPYAIGLCALKTMLCKNSDKIRLKNCCLLIVETLFAANLEQMAFILFGSSLLVIFLKLVKKDIIKNYHYALIVCIISLIEILLILYCPGNNARLEKEILTWYPDFLNFSLLQKVVLGFLSTISSLIMNNFFPNLFLLCIVPYILMRTKEKGWIILVSLIPVGIIFACYYFNTFFTKCFSSCFKINSELLMWATGAGNFIIDIKTLGIIFLCCIFLLSLFISLFFCFKEKKDSFIALLMFVVGILSRVVMGFSPTVYASSLRTFIFLHFAIIGSLFFIINKNHEVIKLNLIWKISASVSIIIFMDIVFCAIYEGLIV